MFDFLNLNILLVFSDWSLLLLRLVVGIIFLVHGWPKLKKLTETWGNFSMMGFKPGWFWGTIVAVLEVVGGTLLVLGIWVQVPALLLAVQMVVATLWKIKKGEKFSGGYELDLLLVAGALVLATIGGGSFFLF